MPTTLLPLQDLAQRIQNQEAALAKLRHEYETRQSQLAELERRKEGLQAQLQEVEAEIQAAGQMSAAPSVSISKSIHRKKTVTASSSSVPAKRISLAQFVVDFVTKAKRPITAKELADEAVRTKYPTTSSNIRGIIESRLVELVKKGVFSRVADQPGVVLGKAPAANKPGVVKAKNAREPGGEKKSNALPALEEKKLSLQGVLTQLLASSPRPLTAAELTERALANGHQTKSKDFKNVIWARLGTMSNVEQVPGGGYRLKKGKVSPARK